MSYVKDNFLPNEKILYSANIHSAVFLNATGTFIFTIFIFIFSLNLASQSPTNSTSIALSIVASMFLFISLIFSLLQSF